MFHTKEAIEDDLFFGLEVSPHLALVTISTPGSKKQNLLSITQDKKSKQLIVKPLTLADTAVIQACGGYPNASLEPPQSTGILEEMKEVLRALPHLDTVNIPREMLTAWMEALS